MVWPFSLFKINSMTPDLSHLSKQQKQVIDVFESGKNIFVTGGAGSGKSYLLNFIKLNYGHLGLEVTASTGIAAVNISGSTIYSWAGIGLANLPVEKIIENLFSAKFSKIRRRIKMAKALAIDEISMISPQVLEILDEVLRAVRQSDKVMGGIQMVFFGDFLQLPPVQDSNNPRFCFDSKVWQDLNLNTFVLDQIFRQSDKKFVKVLNNLRVGTLDEDDVDILKSRLGAVDTSSIIKPTILTTHNFKVEKINQLELQKIASKEFSYEAKYYGNESKIEFLKKNSIVAQLLKVKVGAQVMMTKNTYQKDGIINGSLGIVRDFSPKKLYPIVEFFNGKILTISPQDWVVEKYDAEKKLVMIEAGVTQIPLILAWAMTIHKSQGLTLDKISCDLSEAFSPGQIYVALSRARSLEGVFIESINFNKITSNQSAVEFYESFR